jgi:ABC-2 type transport system ATP-binding protein
MIEATGLTKEFKSYKKYPGLKGSVKSLFSREAIVRKAVDNLSFTIAKGEAVGVIGANGAGKSTTIKMMSGILVPTAGRCEVAGLVPYENRAKNARNIGVVFGQRTQLWWDLPLTETFQILKEIYDVGDADFRCRMDFLNQTLGLPEFVNGTVRTLSLGQRMRADLAASLLHNPPVLYLDEPTIGLDVVVKDKIREAIRNINAEYRTTIVLTTHDLRDIEELCGRIMIIDEGRKIYDGSLSAIKSRYGGAGVLGIEPRNPEAFRQLDLPGRFPGVTCEFKDGRAVVTYDKNKLTSAELLNCILRNTEVSDITLGETGIEEIVKRIYSEGIKP